MPWTYEYRDKPRPCYRIQDGSDDGDVAEAWDEDVAQAIVALNNAQPDAPGERAADVLSERDAYLRALEDITEDAETLMPNATKAGLQDAVLGIKVVADNALNGYADLRAARAGR